jgi:hypothetical protein
VGEELYRDRWIRCTDDGIDVRGYYFPWGTKHIPYAAIRGLTRVPVRGLSGRGRLWGTAHPHYWASLDPGRARKRIALVLDLGASVRPYLTPDDPDAVATLITKYARAGVVADARAPRVV